MGSADMADKHILIFVGLAQATEDCSAGQSYHMCKRPPSPAPSLLLLFMVGFELFEGAPRGPWEPELPCNRVQNSTAHPARPGVRAADLSVALRGLRGRSTRPRQK